MRVPQATIAALVFGFANLQHRPADAGNSAVQPKHAHDALPPV